MATTRTMAPHNTTSLTAANAPIGLTKGGPKGPTSYAGWSATQAMASAGGGYEVLWSHTVANMMSGRLMHRAASSPVLKLSYGKMKLSLAVDINGDGDTGLVTIEANGAVHLKHGDNTYNGAPQYYIVDGS